MTTRNPAPVGATVPGSETMRAMQPAAVEPADVAGKDVAGEDVGDQAEDPLTVIRREMLAIADRLNGNDTSPATQLAQQRVIDRLSALLAGNQASPSVEPNSSAESTSQPAETANQSGTGKDANPRTSGQANESARTTGTTRDVPRGWGKLWGNLPNRIRDQILTPDREQFLPAYEDLIKRYYERLAREDERPR